VLAFLTDLQVVRKILEHLGIGDGTAATGTGTFGGEGAEAVDGGGRERGMGQERGLSARELGRGVGKRGLGAGSTLSETGRDVGMRRSEDSGPERGARGGALPYGLGPPEREVGNSGEDAPNERLAGGVRGWKRS